MPFGLIFGSLFFGLLCSGVGLGLLRAPAPSSKIAGLALTVLGISLAVDLLRRRGWARWVGVAAGAVVAVFAASLVVSRGQIVDHALLFAAVATTGLLTLPATGRVPEQSRSRSGGPLRWTAAAGLAGLVGAALWGAASTPSPTARSTQNDLPASAIVKRVSWTDYGAGLDRARAENRPMLVTFVTSWCPYCSKMDKNTWRSSSVVERLGQLIPVKVNAEETRERNGFSGAELAERYRVRGYPANFLVDADGAVISRRDGYLTPSQLLAWLDRETPPLAGATRASAAGG